MTGGDRVAIGQMRRYAWMNIIAGFLIWGIALAGVSMMMPIMYNTISQDMGWTVTQTTSFMAIKSAVSALGGLFAGGLFVKYGLKRVFVPSVVIVGLSTCLLYFVNNLPVYYVLAAISGFASILCLIAIQVTLAQWYSASLGRITGIAMLGGAVAGAIVPMATSFGLQHYGWHATAAIGGVIVLVFLTLAVLFLVHETPEAYGYTAEELDPGRNKAAPLPGQPVDHGPDFKSFLKTPQFALLILATALSGVISNGINEYIPLFIERHTDLGSYVAALGFTIVIVISGLGKILFGWVFDRFSTRGVALCWAVCGVAVLLTFPVAGFATFLVFTIVRGISHGGVVVQAPVLARHIYGVKSLPQVISLLNASFHLGASAGIAAIGVGVDLSGGFTLPFVAVAVIAFLTAVLGLRFVPKYWIGYAPKGA
ncbi:MFS transporter [Sphingobium jiangsuense]|uniref:MFS family permease n=1 Tax=Sphingobium jiangsuense TaxID=870476 RepID=A0A7W6BGN7_9SPHN|nr:MFS transporter [Sphingobium jiangsuense]MBB3926553.1 MFS family permease [Sphingobium jiangsuense]GLT01423.1 MFS transporter [Sphingobium jiangsuense]